MSDDCKTKGIIEIPPWNYSKKCLIQYSTVWSLLLSMYTESLVNIILVYTVHVPLVENDVFKLSLLLVVWFGDIMLYVHYPRI